MEEVVHLVVESGPDQRRELTVPPEGARAGRAANNDIVIHDPTLSRHHCRFFFKGNELWVADLGSANGTLINGRAVAEARLRVRDRVAVGDTVFRVIHDGEKGALRVRREPSATAQPPDEVKVPLWIRIPAWLFLWVWFCFLAYSLTFPPLQPVAPEPAETVLPSRSSETSTVKTESPGAEITLSDQPGSAELNTASADKKDGTGASLGLAVARELVAERFQEALRLIGDKTWPVSPGAEAHLDQWTAMVSDISKMNEIIALALATNVGRRMTLNFQGKKQVVIPRAVSGDRLMVVSTNGTAAHTINIKNLSPQDRSRLLGKPDTPAKAAMQFILAWQDRDYNSAATFATNCAILSEAFSRLLAEQNRSSP